MIGIACTLVAAWFQAGILDLGPNHIKIVAIGDFAQPSSPAWDAEGRRLSPTEAKAIKGIPQGHELGFDADSLRTKTDLGRFVVLQLDRSEEWRLKEDFRDRRYLGSHSRDASDVTLYLSLPKGTESFDIPFAALHSKQGKLLLEFTESSPKRSGDMTVAVTSHEAAQVTYTKPKNNVLEKKFPLIQYIVTLVVPSTWSERFLDLEAPGVVWPKSKRDSEPMGPENMHGIMDERPIGKGKLQISLTIATPGPKLKNQKLRLVERELFHAVMKNLPAMPQAQSGRP